MNRHAKRPATAHIISAVAAICFATAGATVPFITTAATAPTASAAHVITVAVPKGCCVNGNGG